MSSLIVMAFIFLLGWVAGRTMNYLSDVLPAARQLIYPVCPHCQNKQNLSTYLLPPYHCYHCHYRPGIRTLIVDLLAITATLWLWFYPPTRLGFWVGWTLMLYLGTVAIIDIEHHLILHPTSIAGAILCAAIGAWRHGIFTTIIGGLAGFIIMLLLYIVGDYLAKRLSLITKKEQNKEPALGFGDVALGGITGLLLGWPGIIAAITLTILAAGIFGLLHILWALLHHQYRAFASSIPFGPFFILSIVLLLYR